MGKNEKVAANIAPFDGGVRAHHSMCFDPRNFPDGKVPPDLTGVLDQIAR